jgi:hypothetical protein
MLLEDLIPKEVSVSTKGQQEATRRVVGFDLSVSRVLPRQAELSRVQISLAGSDDSTRRSSSFSVDRSARSTSFIQVDRPCP